jgi:flagellar biosynthesis protein FlhG
VALNLAVALNQIGYRAALVDAAPYADVTHLAGIDNSAVGCVDDVIDGMWEINEALLAGPAGIHVLAGRSTSPDSPDRSAQSAERLLGRLQALTAPVDVVLFDTGSGGTPWSRALWQHAAMALVVTTPDDVAVLDTYATVKRIAPATGQPDIRVLVNQCDDAATATDVERRLADACRRFLGLTIGRAPRLVRHDSDRCGIEPLCAWDMAGSTFSRAVNQLGRFAVDVLSRHRCAAAPSSGCHHPQPEFSSC